MLNKEVKNFEIIYDLGFKVGLMHYLKERSLLLETASNPALEIKLNAIFNDLFSFFNKIIANFTEEDLINVFGPSIAYALLKGKIPSTDTLSFSTEDFYQKNAFLEGYFSGFSFGRKLCFDFQTIAEQETSFDLYYPVFFYSTPYIHLHLELISPSQRVLFLYKLIPYDNEVVDLYLMDLYKTSSFASFLDRIQMFIKFSEENRLYQDLLSLFSYFYTLLPEKIEEETLYNLFFGLVNKPWATNYLYNFKFSLEPQIVGKLFQIVEALNSLEKNG